MATKTITALKAAIIAAIYTNTGKSVTGNVLQAQLIDMVDSLQGSVGLTLINPTGTPNGALTAFTLPSAPTGDVVVFINGIMTPEADYSVSGTTLTITVAPLTGDVISVLMGLSGSGGGAGTKTLGVFTALDLQPPATSYAVFDTRNSMMVLNFDDAAVWSVLALGVMPEAASLASGLIVRLHWMALTATTGNVRWRVEFERSNSDLDIDSFDTAVEATGTCDGTSGIETVTAITSTTIDGIAAGDMYRLRVSRIGSDATNDTMIGYAQLVAVEVRSAA